MTRSIKKPRNAYLISTNEFHFGRPEMGFIRRHIRKLYPSVMMELVEHTSEFMQWLQTDAKVKYFYTIDRHHPDDRGSYHVSEMLHVPAVPETEGQRGFISIQPVEPDRKRLFRSPIDHDGGFDEVLSNLDHWIAQEQDPLEGFVIYGGISAKTFAQNLRLYVSRVREATLLRQYALSLDNEPGVILDIGHQNSQSHYVRIRFDFFQRIQPPPEGVGVSPKLHSSP